MRKIQDDSDLIDYMSRFLRVANCEVRSAKDGDAALQEAFDFRPEIVFLDIVIPEQDGWLVCSKLKSQPHPPVIVLMTGMTEENTGDFARFVHADELLRKPFSEEEVLKLLNQRLTAR